MKAALKSGARTLTGSGTLKFQRPWRKVTKVFLLSGALSFSEKEVPAYAAAILADWPAARSM
jgi:hypothetical protein